MVQHGDGGDAGMRVCAETGDVGCGADPPSVGMEHHQHIQGDINRALTDDNTMNNTT